MSKKRRMLLTTCCLLALLANGVGAFGQKQAQEKMPPPPPEGEMQTRIVLAPAQAPNGEPPMRIMPDGPVEPAGFAIISDGMNFAGPVVKGAPYSGEAVTESTQTLADGNRITHKSTALIYRDSEGRTRREQTLNNVGPFATSGDAPTVIFINDPVAGANYTLDPRTKTARKGEVFNFRVAPPAERLGPVSGVMEFAPRGEGAPPPDAPPMQGGLGAAVKRVEPAYPDAAKAAGAEGPVTVQIMIDEQGNVTSARAVSGNPLLQAAAVDAARQWVFKPAGGTGRAAKVSGSISFNFRLDKNNEDLPPAGEPRGPKPVRESLGTQNIEGVATEGTRFTITLPAGMVGNEQAINIVNESWFSSELHVLVMSKHSDPRFGETTYRLTNINRSEPAHSLFEVPADYTIKQGDPMRREFRMRQPENEQ